MPKQPRISQVLEGLAARVCVWFTRDGGQGLTEYALILALIAIAAIVGLHLLGGKVNDALSTVGSSLQA